MLCYVISPFIFLVFFFMASLYIILFYILSVFFSTASFHVISFTFEPFYTSAQNAAFETIAVKRFLCNLHSSVPNARPNRVGSSTRAF
jgi:hypothetical protein